MLRQVADVDLDTQLNVFEDEALADEEALTDQLNIPAIDMEYPLCMAKPLWGKEGGRGGHTRATSGFLNRSAVGDVGVLRGRRDAPRPRRSTPRSWRSSRTPSPTTTLRARCKT